MREIIDIALALYYFVCTILIVQTIIKARKK